VIMSRDGKLAVVSSSEAWAAGVTSIRRGGARCLCGGPDPQDRAVNAMMKLAGGGMAVWALTRTIPRSCSVGHELYMVVDMAEWPARTFTFNTDYAKPPSPPAPSPTPAKRVVPDWPLACPKCHRPSSAVLLFRGYDCRHGCFK
jgi:hypothetical protein